MNNKRNRWLLIGALVLITLLVSGFVLTQPSPKDLLVQSLEASQAVTDGHAKVTIVADTIEESETATLEIWARQGEDHEGAFRIQVLETTKDEAQGALIVSDGETLWAYSPVENKVFVGTPEDAKAMLKENEFFSSRSKDGEFSNGEKDDLDGQEHQLPKNAEEAVDKLFEYVKARRSGSDNIAGESAYLLKMEPIPDQMPDEYTAVGGLFHLWISETTRLPVAFEYTGGALGEISLTVLEYEFNQGVNETLFTFDIPVGAEVVTFEDLEPKELTLDEAKDSAGKTFLTPVVTPDGAKLIDIIEVQSVLVQRYALPDGGSFTIAQGTLGEVPDQLQERTSEGKTVPLRSVNGTLSVSDDGTQTMLTWAENGLFLAVAGDVSPEQALSIAESLQ